MPGDVRIRTSLGQHVGRAASPVKIEQLAGRAWREQGVAVIRPDELADPWEAQVIRNVANRLHGRRNNDQPE